MTLILAALAGGAFGYVLERGAFCFHATWRGLLVRPAQLDLARGYLLLLLVATPLVQAMRGLGWIEPYIAPLAWRAALLGGLIFGLGMVIASSCITGLFYKLGQGMLGAAAGLAAWAAGDVVTYRGPLASWREDLNADPVTADGSAATVANTLGPAGVVVVVALGTAGVWYLWRSPRADRGRLWRWPRLGATTALVIAGAWLLAAADGVDYPYGTSGVPTRVWDAVVHSDTAGSWWIAIAVVAVIPGAVLAARLGGTRWLRGETARRYAELSAGGFVMGIGAGIAGGCNLGHATVGVPLLSLGSISATAAMIAGVALADRAAGLARQARQARQSRRSRLARLAAMPAGG